MSNATGKRTAQRGSVLFGIAGGMLVVAGGFIGGYYMMGSRAVAAAATTNTVDAGKLTATGTSQDVKGLLDRAVDVKTATGSTKLTWAELGAEADPDEGGRVLRIDRDKAAKALQGLKAKTDRASVDARLDLEAKKIIPDMPGQGLDVWGSIAQLEVGARTGAASLQLATTSIPATVTKASLGIEDISEVMGHWETAFPVSDRDRNFNLKLAASKVDGVVLKPGAVWSFNEQVGERSQKNGYKIAHVITAGEMVDGLAGGTCQISTTLFGAAFFAGLDIVDTRNHSRPSAYTPLGFDATVVWPNTDLKLKNPYDFPVVLRYVVANGQAKVEVLGKKRPYEKIVFSRSILEEMPFSSEERLDDTAAEGEQIFDQKGFPGFKIHRQRDFYRDGKVVKTNKWLLVYKPVTEYIRRGTSKDPDAKKLVQKPDHGPRMPTSAGGGHSQ